MAIEESYSELQGLSVAGENLGLLLSVDFVVSVVGDTDWLGGSFANLFALLLALGLVSCFDKWVYLGLELFKLFLRYVKLTTVNSSVIKGCVRVDKLRYTAVPIGLVSWGAFLLMLCVVMFLLCVS